MVLNIRTFRRNASQLGDGRVVFPKAQIANGIIPTGGQLVYADNGTDVQTQITTLAASVAAIDVHAHVDVYCYVDVSRSAETYTETGSQTQPYRSLDGAMSVKLTHANTDTVIFKLAPGKYIGPVVIDQNTANQSFQILGSGSENCFIQASQTFDATKGDVLSFRDFIDITVRDVTIMCGAYGLYTRDTGAVTISGCRFQFLGSDGYAHQFTTSAVDLDTYWQARGTAGAHRSDGGAMRIRNSTNVRISDCEVFSTLRGYRIQDCAQGQITNCSASYTLESAYYLASGSYTGSAGCSNFQITGCKANDIFHQAFLVIGGANNTIQGCTARRCANGGVVCWHTQDLKIIGNTFDECNTHSYAGIGTTGDSYGQIFQQNKTDITDTEGYALTCLGNVFLRCGQGRESAVYTFFFMELWDTTVDSFRVVIDGNSSDAAIAVKNNTSVPLVSTQYPPPAAGGLSGATGNRVMVTDGNGDASVSAVTAATLGYLDVTESIDASLTNRVKLSHDLDFPNNITCRKAFYIYDNVNNTDALFQMNRDGGHSTFKIEHRGSNVRWKLSGDSKYYIYADGRHQYEGQFVQVPYHDDTPSAAAGNSKGGLWLDTSVSPAVLKYHNGADWKTVAAV